MIGSPANANVQISINTFKADVQEGSLRHNITVNIDITILATAQNNSTKSRTFRTSYNVQGPLSASNEKSLTPLTAHSAISSRTWLRIPKSASSLSRTPATNLPCRLLPDNAGRPAVFQSLSMRRSLRRVRIIMLRSIWATYSERNARILLLLGFASGLPLALTSGTLEPGSPSKTWISGPSGFHPCQPGLCV